MKKEYIFAGIIFVLVAFAVYFLVFRKPKQNPITTNTIPATGTGTGTTTPGTITTTPPIFANSVIAEELAKTTRFPADKNLALFWLNYVNSGNYPEVNQYYLQNDFFPPTPENMKVDLINTFGNDPVLVSKLNSI